MHRKFKELARRGAFHDLAGVHDGNIVRDLHQQGKIVCDEKNGKTQLFPQGGNLLENILLHHHIQGGGGFIHDQQGRIQGQGDGDDSPLAHPTG